MLIRIIKTMSTLKIYKDSKELPFWNYKRIMQTGDFLYLIKGYESGDEIVTDLEELKLKFDAIVEDYVMTNNAKSEDILNYGRYLSAVNTVNKLTIVVGILELKIKGSIVGLDISQEDIDSVLSLFKVQRSDDLQEQIEILLNKIAKHKNELSKLKNIIDKVEEKTDESEESDLDEQFINVCVGLETGFVDETKISLYQYGMMVKVLIKRIEELNKMNSGNGK